MRKNFISQILIYHRKPEKQTIKKKEKQAAKIELRNHIFFLFFLSFHN